MFIPGFFSTDTCSSLQFSSHLEWSTELTLARRTLAGLIFISFTSASGRGQESLLFQLILACACSVFPSLDLTCWRLESFSKWGPSALLYGGVELRLSCTFWVPGNEVFLKHGRLRALSFGIVSLTHLRELEMEYRLCFFCVQALGKELW